MKQHFQVIAIRKQHWIWLGIIIFLIVTVILLWSCTSNHPFAIQQQDATMAVEDAEDSTDGVDKERHRRENAERWYSQSCALCHGDQLEGRLKNPPLLNLENKYSTADVYTIIIDGKGEMPGGFLQGSEARAVAEWLIEE